MFALFSFLVFFLSSILQLTIIPRLFLFGAVPNLVLVLIILWSVLFGFRRIFWLALFSGFILDLFSGSHFGIFIIVFLLVAFLSDLATEYIFSNNYFFSVLSLCLIFTVLINFTFDYLSLGSFFSDVQLIYIFILSLILNLILIAILFPLANNFKDRISLYQKKEKLPY